LSEAGFAELELAELSVAQAGSDSVAAPATTPAADNLRKSRLVRVDILPSSTE
jgi:hypothetical protein